jgi:serine/threonine-protein kinase
LFPQVFGKYVLERELSRGGMARVVLATLRGAGGFEKRLVVKQIRDELAFDQQFVRRFVEEAKTTVALSHPNIVPVYELGVEQGTYFLAMELVEGVSVAELLKERNADGSRRVLAPEEAAYVGVEVCRALDYAHRRMQVVHRDITPRNVMIDEEGQIKLIDFGIAAPALVSGQEILGSPGHMAPEQLDGSQLGPPTDIFAVAVLLMEAWTGTAPFRRATPEECAAAVRETHPKPSEFDPRLAPLDAAIGRAMNVDPKARQQQASDLARALRGFLQGSDVADLARGLGDRVRHLRENTASTPPPSRASGPRPSAASHGDLGTKTFAARDDALHWSEASIKARESSPSDELPVPSTRRLASSARMPTAAPARRVQADDPAMGIPTPLMVDIDDLERIHADIAAAKAQSKETGERGEGRAQRDIPTVRRKKMPPPADKLETIATRPLEAPIDARAPPSTPVAAGSSSRKIAAGVLAVVVAGGGIAAWRSQQDGSRTEPRPPTVTSALTALAPSAATPPSAPPAPAEIGSAKAVASTHPEDRAPATPPATSGAAVAAPSGSALPVAGKASVALVGDPGTRVWIDGASRGGCPARVTLEPGSHEVRFTFDPTGESRVERFSVKSGDRVTVRADFTSATPTVKIQRLP